MKWRKCKDMGYWRSLGTKITVTRGQISEQERGPVPKGKRVPIKTARGEYRWERMRYLSALGLSPSHRQVVKAGKEIRRMRRLLNEIQETGARQVTIGGPQP